MKKKIARILYNWAKKLDKELLIKGENIKVVVKEGNYKQSKLDFLNKDIK